MSSLPRPEAILEPEEACLPGQVRGRDGVSLPMSLTLGLAAACASLVGAFAASAFDFEPWPTARDLAGIVGWCGGLGLVYGHLCGRWAHRGGATATAVCLLGGVLAGCLAISGIAAGTMLTTSSNPFFDGSSGVPSSFAMSLIVGMVVGGPLGFAFALACLAPVLYVGRASRPTPHDESDRLVLVCGLWVGAVAVAGLAVLGITSSSAIASGWSTELGAELLPDALCGVAATLLVVVALGGVAVTVSLRRQRARRAWFGRVLLGQEPGWTIAPADDVLPKRIDLRPLFRESAHDPRDVILFLSPDETPATYRHGPVAVPAALV